MLFDFQRFGRIAASVYNQENPYSLEECLKVFRLYFQTYEEYMGRPHPPIRREQIARIMEEMPYIIEEDKGGYCADVDIELYPLLIQLHFKTGQRIHVHHTNSGG